MNVIVTNGEGKQTKSKLDLILPPKAIPSYLRLSPFYRNEAKISNLVSKLMSYGRDELALVIMRQVVANERIWRRKMCYQLFGRHLCVKNGVNNEPFHMWKKKLIHELLMDPTPEIIRRVRQNVSF